MGERPVECGHCKKSVKVTYKEIVGDIVTITEMCGDCPVLQQKLGSPIGETTKNNLLICGHCKTSLDAILRGDFVGCIECYSVFKDPLIRELIARDELPARLVKILEKKKNEPLHKGKSPGKPTPFMLSTQLSTLTKELSESLKRENYEQAAWLRDQIKSLKEKTDDRKE